MSAALAACDAKDKQADDTTLEITNFHLAVFRIFITNPFRKLFGPSNSGQQAACKNHAITASCGNRLASSTGRNVVRYVSVSHPISAPVVRLLSYVSEHFDRRLGEFALIERFE